MRYWVYAPGYNASHWDEFYSKGIMGLGWDELGDLNNYQTKEDIVKRLQELEKTEGSKKNDATANDEFKNVMAIGDIVFVKTKRDEFIGYGIVSSDYYYDDSRTDFKKCRKVDWQKKGIWKANHNIVQKTLTDITKYPDYVVSIKELFEIDIMKEQKALTGNYPKNIILYGPPGTGKTYNSIDKAVEIVMGKSFLHYESKTLFDNLRKEGQIEFVTFHQNYSYEDFMVGIKPDIDFEQLRFKTHKGIFYEICRRAKENYESNKTGQGKKKSFEEVFEKLIEPLDLGKEVEVKMKSGISYWITESSEKSISFRKQSGGTAHTLSINSLKDLVEGTKEIPSGLSPYYSPLIELIKNQSSTDEKAEPLKNFVLVIDEINRANISKVFGELITLLEDDKRLGEENELKITLPNGEKGFGVPPNLYLIGTMNTADKSIALIDIALRRRFEFMGYYPKYEGYELEAIDLLKKININIFEKKKSADYLIGHAYFMKRQTIETVLANKVIPLLMEYFSGKIEIVSSIFNGSAYEAKYDSTYHHWVIEKG